MIKFPAKLPLRTFLQAGKHVCVEYPMTLSYKAAVELLDIAQEKGEFNYSQKHEMSQSDGPDEVL